MGMNGALDTLVSQAYGAEQHVLCGVYLNRARLINTFIFIPLMGILLCSKYMLSALGTEQAVIEHATTFVQENLLSFYLLGMYDL